MSKYDYKPSKTIIVDDLKFLKMGDTEWWDVRWVKDDSCVGCFKNTKERRKRSMFENLPKRIKEAFLKGIKSV